MNEPAVNATMHGGTAGLVGVGVAHIENLYVSAPTSALAATRSAGPIPPCPYPGLAYFGPEDAVRFFGREQAIQALVAAVTKRSFTALVGASGSGKSSVVLAGLWPRLDALGGWRSTYFRIGTEPDKNPFSALARALEPLTGERGLSDKLEEVQKLSQKLATGSISLTNTIGQCRAANPGKRILLIADQFEELFTLVPDEGLRNRFIDPLIAAFHDPSLGTTPTVCLVMTLRADFYNAALRYRPLADRLQDHVENLGPMTREELREAIVKPADAVQVGYEPGLVDTILDDVERRPGSLPLLQFALREMWARLKTPQMSRGGYDAIDGVDGALAKRAQTIFKDNTKGETDMQAVALFRRLFTRLVTLGESSEDTRRIVTKQELNTDEWSLAQRLAGEENRLVVTASTNSGEDTAEVVHEALIRNWPELVNWINRDRAFISWRNQLKGRLDDWRPDPSDIGTMLRGGPLAVAEDWIARRGDDLNQEEQAFVAASITLRDAEKCQAEEALRREKARLRQAKWITAGVGLIVIATGALVSYQDYVNRALDGYLTHVEVDVKKQLNYLQAEGARQDKTIADLALKENQVALKEEEINSNVESTHGTIEEKIHEIRNLHANLLGEFSAAELARGDIDTALRLAAIGTKEVLALQLKSDAGSASTTALAAAISKAASRFASSPEQEALLFEALSHGGSGVVAAANGVMRIGDIPHPTMSGWDLLDEVCQHHPITSSTLTRDEMRLAGYPDSEPLIDVCAGVAGAGQ